jgi:hypothetical protein
LFSLFGLRDRRDRVTLDGDSAGLQFSGLSDAEVFETQLTVSHSNARQSRRFRAGLNAAVQVSGSFFIGRSARPAGVLATQSIEGQHRLERVMRLASQSGLAELREYVMRSYLILYAHSDTRVLLLSIRHPRELGYVPEKNPTLRREIRMTHSNLPPKTPQKIGPAKG